MRIIENGFEKHPWLEKVTCTKGCKSVLEAEADDVQYEEWSDMGGEDNHQYFVRCPVCGFKISLKDSKVPELIKGAAQKRHRGR